MTIDEIMKVGPVIPVLVIDQVANALPIAQALVTGGVSVLEVTLRTDAAIDAIREMTQVDGAIVGAGTVLNERQLDQAIDAGAKFIVSPGLTTKLGEAAVERGIPFLPGIASAADIMRGLDLGFDRFKFFPAETSGGVKALRALAAPFYQCRFCPTGGVTEQTAPAWLAVDAVQCVGGSWLVPAGEPDFEEIRARATFASRLAAT